MLPLGVLTSKPAHETQVELIKFNLAIIRNGFDLRTYKILPVLYLGADSNQPGGVNYNAQELCHTEGSGIRRATVLVPVLFEIFVGWKASGAEAMAKWLGAQFAPIKGSTWKPATRGQKKQGWRKDGQIMVEEW